jgi:hypothetical protein
MFDFTFALAIDALIAVLMLVLGFFILKTDRLKVDLQQMRDQEQQDLGTYSTLLEEHEKALTELKEHKEYIRDIEKFVPDSYHWTNI